MARRSLLACVLASFLTRCLAFFAGAPHIYPQRGRDCGTTKCSRPIALAPTTPLHLASSGDEVVDFELEDFSVETLDSLNDLITAVKQNGEISAAQDMLFDLGGATEWILMQVAYDRNVRRFSATNTLQLQRLAEFLPDDATCVFTGTLSPRAAKRLLRVRNLRAVVVSDIDGAASLHEALIEEKERVSAKPLNKVSKSRERFLTQGAPAAAGAGAGRRAAPETRLPQRLGVYVVATDDINGGSEAASALVEEIQARLPSLEVLGLWGQRDACVEAWQNLRRVENGRNVAGLRLVLPFVGGANAKKHRESGAASAVWRFTFPPSSDLAKEAAAAAAAAEAANIDGLLLSDP